MSEWLRSCPELALACGFSYDQQKKLHVPSSSQQWKRRHIAGAPLFESLYLISVLAPAHHPRPLLRGFRVHTLICRGSGLPLQFLVSPANIHDSPFARPLLELAVSLYHIRPRIIRRDAAYWGLRLIRWIHETLGAVAVIPWNPKRAAQTALACLLPGGTRGIWKTEEH